MAAGRNGSSRNGTSRDGTSGNGAGPRIGVPSAPETTYDRPLSVRGNAPPMYSL